MAFTFGGILNGKRMVKHGEFSNRRLLMERNEEIMRMLTAAGGKR